MTFTSHRNQVYVQVTFEVFTIDVVVDASFNTNFGVLYDIAEQRVCQEDN